MTKRYTVKQSLGLWCVFDTYTNTFMRSHPDERSAAADAKQRNAKPTHAEDAE